MSESKHTDYRLEIWNGKEYIRTYAYSDGSRDEHNDVIRALIRDPDYIEPGNEFATMRYRIVRCDKKRTLKPARKDMNWGSATGRRNLGDGATLKEQAQAAANHYIKLRTRDLTTHLDPSIKTDVPVYPVKPSGRGVASEFRMLLAFLLTGATRTSQYWGWSQEKTRRDAEAQLADHGYTFTEVDLGDYA